jgi:phosphonoacetate hydrolase
METAKVIACLQRVEGIELVLTRAEAVQRFHLPGDRIGDLVVLSDAHTVVGVSEDYHDLQHVREGLRSHGGLHEVEIPLILNRPLSDAYQEKRRQGMLFHNYDIFDLALNGVRR